MIPKQVLNQLEAEYNNLTPPVRTGDYRALAKVYHKTLKQYSLSDLLLFCEQLLQANKRGYTIIAYQLVDQRHTQFTRDTFQTFDHWVNSYLQDWWDCDDFMTHAMGRLYIQYPELWSDIKAWSRSDKFAVRRASAVVLIPASKKNVLDIKRALEISDILQEDDHYLVQKGFGWLLKEATKHYKNDIIKYLEKNVSTLSRTAFRYAIEKLSKSEKERLMSL